MPNCKCQNYQIFQFYLLKIFQNFNLDLKAPVLGVQRHSNFKELRKPFRVSKPKNATISLVCMSGTVFGICACKIFGKSTLDNITWKHNNKLGNITINLETSLLSRKHQYSLRNIIINFTMSFKI